MRSLSEEKVRLWHIANFLKDANKKEEVWRAKSIEECNELEERWLGKRKDIPRTITYGTLETKCRINRIMHLLSLLEKTIILLLAGSLLHPIFYVTLPYMTWKIVTYSARKYYTNEDYAKAMIQCSKQGKWYLQNNEYADERVYDIFEISSIVDALEDRQKEEIHLAIRHRYLTMNVLSRILNERESE